MSTSLDNTDLDEAQPRATIPRLHPYTDMGEDDPEFDPDTERDLINAETENPR